MLVLSRKPSERIMIGNDIVIQVIEIRGDKIRIGIEADRSIPVFREEIVKAAAEPGRASTPSDPPGDATESRVGSGSNAAAGGESCSQH